MNKYLFIFLAFVSTTLSAQNTAPNDTITPIIETINDENVLTEKQILQDSINSTLVPLNEENLSPKKFDPDFREKYSEAQFRYDIKEESGFLARLREMWNDFLDWFSFDTSGSSVVMDEVINIILLILGLIALGLLIYYLNKKGFIRLFSKRTENVINEKYIEENIEKIDFEQLVKSAKQENNLRKAIRYYYLWMLKNWSQNNFITYEPNKTTKKYLSEIIDTKNKTAFQYVSYIYDNVWYGSHEISAIDFAKIEQHFMELINKKS